jgi:hypothetical protein
VRLKRIVIPWAASSLDQLHGFSSICFDFENVYVFFL